MVTLFEDIPLARMNTSMTINATAPWLLALYIALAEERGVSPKVLDPAEPQPAARGNVRQVIRLRQGIGEDLARDLVKRIRGIAPKVQPRIQGDTLRVSSRDKDQLQAVIAGLKALDLPTPLQFINYR